LVGYAEIFCYVQVIYDKTTGRSRGFGFVTMSTAEEVEAAAQQFNGYVSTSMFYVLES
jgi:RNA recognition motif-containing protein